MIHDYFSSIPLGKLPEFNITEQVLNPLFKYVPVSTRISITLNPRLKIKANFEVFHGKPGSTTISSKMKGDLKGSKITSLPTSRNGRG